MCIMAQGDIDWEKWEIDSIQFTHSWKEVNIWF